MSYISNLEIAELIEASKGYGDQLDRVDNDPPHEPVHPMLLGALRPKIGSKSD